MLEFVTGLGQVSTVKLQYFCNKIMENMTEGCSLVEHMLSIYGPLGSIFCSGDGWGEGGGEDEMIYRSPMLKERRIFQIGRENDGFESDLFKCSLQADVEMYLP